MNELATAFQRDGAVVVRNLLTAEEVGLLREAIDANIAHPSPRAIVASGKDDPGRFVEDFRNWTGFEGYRKVILESGLGKTAAELMNSEVVRLHHDHMLTKESGTRQRTPWHQDQPFYNIEGMQNCSFWIPVDPVDRPASLEFVAGSHLGPWLMPRSFRDNEAKWFPDGALADLPDVEASREAFPIIGWAVEPGDAICFHMLTLHSAGGSPRRRRAFSVRCIGDDIRHEPRRWKTSPDFPELASLPAGVPLEGTMFPVIWPKAGENM